MGLIASRNPGCNPGRDIRRSIEFSFFAGNMIYWPSIVWVSLLVQVPTPRFPLELSIIQNNWKFSKLLYFDLIFESN